MTPSLHSIQKEILYRIILSICFLIIFQISHAQKASQGNQEGVIRIEMDLSAYGVESRGFPTIKAVIDLYHDSRLCKVSYYEPELHDTAYKLTKPVMDSIRYLVNNCDLKKLKKNYSIDYTDQPTSTTIFYLKDEQITITDYGLEGDQPLRALYKFVYQLEFTFR